MTLNAHRSGFQREVQLGLGGVSTGESSLWIKTWVEVCNDHFVGICSFRSVRLSSNPERLILPGSVTYISPGGPGIEGHYK